MPIRIEADGNKEAGLAALFLAALKGKTCPVILRNAPVSYLFDNRENIDFFSMGINLPGLLLQPHLLHRRLVLVGKLPVHGDVLVDGKGFAPGMPGDELQFGIRHAGGLGQKGMPGA